MGDSSCGVCFDELSTYDIEYPILCPTSNCEFNMCIRCISHLIDSSKEDFEMASDGNMHVKVKLQCPSCRGDFSSTIQDILFIRTAMEIHQKYKDIPDTELSSSELRKKYTHTLAVIDETQVRLLKNLQQQIHGSNGNSNYIHQSNTNTIIASITRSQDGNKPLPPLFFPNTRILIDTALFLGLDSVMSSEEQLFVTKLMISGDTHQLAQAAQILHGIANVVRQGYRSHPMGEDDHKEASKTQSHSPSASPRIKPNHSSTVTTTDIRAFEISSSSFTGTQAEHVELENKIQKHFALHPLPTFMPLFISMEADFNIYAKHRKLIKVKDDEWDGSIADGFARTMMCIESSLDTSIDDEDDDEGLEESIELRHQDGDEEIENEPEKNYNLNNEEEEEEDNNDNNDEDKNHRTMTDDDQPNNSEVVNEKSSAFKNGSTFTTTTTSLTNRTRKVKILEYPRQHSRVLIRQARGKAAAMGISAGMVVSHFNGEEFHGTAEELKQRIHQIYLSCDDGNKSFTLVLNADLYTAEALKLRSHFPWQ